MVAGNGIARLNPDDSVDEGFDPGSGLSVFGVAQQSEGKVLIDGAFSTIDQREHPTWIGQLNPDGTWLAYEVGLPYLARLFGDCPPPPPRLSIGRSGALVTVSWPSPSTGFELLEGSNLNPTNWTTSPEVVADNGTTRSISVLPSAGRRFYRLFKP